MQASYPNKLTPTHWDTLNVDFPVHQFLPTGASSETIARGWRTPPEVIKQIRQPNYEELEYNRNYNVTAELTRSQSSNDYGHKTSDRYRCNKHTPWSENEYVYPSSRKLSDRVPATTVHETTEMRRSYKTPKHSSRLVTDKDQYKHPACLTVEPPEVSYQKQIDSLDTTYDGYEKYLDPYLTTSRLHHRPYTARELTKMSNSNDIMTYYTYADVPWIRSPKPKTDQWGLPISRPKSMYDREKFKEDFREIRTHNKLRWVPGTFRTESRDNYIQQTLRPEPQIHNYEEDLTVLQRYSTENEVVGSRKPLCIVFDPYVERNKRSTRRT